MRYLGKTFARVCHRQTNFARVYGIAIVVACLAGQLQLSEAQTERTSTPIRVNLVTPTPAGISQFAPTVTAANTATPLGPAWLQARESAGRVNVRLEPDTNSDLLGSITFGTLYPFLRRYYLWYELGYDLATSGRAWVFSELVEVDGDLDAVPEITDFAEIEISIGTSGDAGAGAALGDASSAVDSADDARNLVITPAAEGQRGAAAIATPLPTFTYPPDIPAYSDTGREISGENDSQDSQIADLSDLPPLFPIALLAGFGIVGILISLIRQ